ncbi:cytochrome P450 2J4-like [Mercenaria mercenaria]|uniref:cytochrome P450 2J4-like n=1 Tax=Mercenaria mercenaria TaxID=6596 RepID=UPI00234F89A6|nr:cytochrome P450 2J4-like [Mercenaria mercenaria]
MGLPILGNLLWLKGLKRKGIKQYQALFEASKTYGDIVSIKVLGQRFVFLHGYETIREAFVKNGDVFSNRPSWLKGLKEATKEGKGVIWQSGNDWKVLRKFVLQTLREFGVGKTSLEQNIMREVDAANDVLYATNGSPPVSLPHTTDVDVTLGGFFIPRKTLIIANLYSSNMDPRHWDQPEIFSPERFMEGGKLKKNPALIPFSIGIVLQSGNAWKVLRKFVMQTLREFGVGKTSLEQKIMREVDAANDVLCATDGNPSDVRLLTSMMISNIIYGIVFAKRFDYKDEKLHEIIENLDKLFQGGGALTPEGMVPTFLRKLFNKEGNKRRENRMRTQKWIKEHIYGEISNHESTFDNENIRDFIDLYLQAKIQHSDENIFNKGNMFRVIMDLFIAGSETTSNTINWCILYMQEYPDIQKKCQEEIFEKCGDKVVTWADRSSLPYIEATLLEIQRMANIAPMSVPHTTEVDFSPAREIECTNTVQVTMAPNRTKNFGFTSHLHQDKNMRFDYKDEKLHEIIENLDKFFPKCGGALTPVGMKCGDKVVTWADRSSLPYIEATLLEIQRMANIAPVSIPHTTDVDVTFGGYYIPRRTLIIVNLYSSNMDPRHWDQPEIFNPERFMEGGKLKKNPALIPFSIGPRICLGESLAKMEMFLIFSNLLQRFTFCREDDNVKHSFENILEQGTSAPKPYKTRAIKRA